MCYMFYNTFDETIEKFKEFSQFALGIFGGACDDGNITENEYLGVANGNKKIYDIITAPDFKKWMKCRADVNKNTTETSHSIVIKDEIMIILPIM